MSTMDEGCEDTELRDLVAQTLENNGVMNKIRAQLRASVFLALEEQPTNENKCPLINKELKEFVKTDEGRIATCLIREFLEHFNLEFTQSVFSPETGESVQYSYNGRDRLLDELGVDKSLPKNGPLLLEVIHRSQLNAAPSKLSPRNILISKEMFNARDDDNNGKIDKESACELFMDIFPNFRRSLVDRFITDEYQTMGKNFNAELNFEEFSSLYKKLFSICQSVTLHDTTLFVPASTKLQKTRMSNIETINISPKSSVDGNLLQNTNHSIMTDNADADDSFYDDLPIQSPKSSNKTKGDTTANSKRCSAGSEGITYRDTLPPLVSTRNDETGGDSPLLATLERDINSKLADLSNEDYDEDFQSSEQKTGSEGSIGEEIEEDTSAFGDILGSTASGISLPGNDNITTDKTVSQVSQSGADYLESFNHDSGDRLKL